MVEELARRTGLTVRSIRSYQTRKLLPPPSVRSRTGYYGEHHIARIELIKDLQSHGMKLEQHGPALRRRSRLRRRPRALPPHPVHAVRRARPGADHRRRPPATVRRHRGRGTRRTRQGDGARPPPRPRQRPPRRGLPPPPGRRRARDGDPPPRRPGRPPRGRAAQRHSQAVTKIYVDLFIERVWTPFADAGRPHDKWPEIEAALADVRTLATEALVSSFELVMSAEVNEVFDREIVRPRPKSSRGRRHGRSRRSGSRNLTLGRVPDRDEWLGLPDGGVADVRRSPDVSGKNGVRSPTVPSCLSANFEPTSRLTGPCSA